MNIIESRYPIIRKELIFFILPLYALVKRINAAAGGEHASNIKTCLSMVLSSKKDVHRIHPIWPTKVLYTSICLIQKIEFFN